MANQINFYESLNDLPSDIINGNIYFILKNDKIAELKVDLNNERYTVKTDIPEATEDNSGLMSIEDKKKLIPIIIEKFSDSDVNIDTIDGKDFNFLQNIKIKNDQILTQNSIAGVEVVPVMEDDPIQENRVEIVSTDDGFKLILHLNIPRGKTGDVGPIGPVGPRGKASRIGEVRATIDEEDGEPDVVVDYNTTETEDEVITDLNFNFLNLKGDKGDKGDEGEKGIQGERGPQGKVANIDFKFQSGTTAGVERIDRETYEEDGQELVKLTYVVNVPHGDKGDKGDSFRISRSDFTSEEDMYAALDEEIIEDDENPSGIPLNTFVLLTLPQADPVNGKLYYRPIEKIDPPAEGEEDKRLIYITDMSPTQPQFSVERNVSIIPWNQTGEVNINNEQLDHPKLNFTLPRGKPMDFGEVDANITYDNNSNAPSIEVETNNVLNENDPDYRRQDIDFKFKNLGKIYSATASANNNVGVPNVTVTPSIEDNKQKLHFTFSNIKGEQGIQGIEGPMPRLKPEINLTVTPGDSSQDPAGTASWSEEEGLKVLNISLTNVKGQDGNIANISYSGDGNAVSDLTYVNRNLTVKKDYQFATEEYVNNKTSQVIQVSKGGTGQTSLILDNILLGNGTDPIKTINVLPVTLGGTGQTSFTRNQILLGQGQNNIGSIETISGALYATNSTDAPHFGTLPIQQGGTGKTGFVNNAIVVGNSNNELKQINSSKGAFYSTGTNEELQFGILPVTLGGTGAITAEQARINIGSPRAEIEVNSVQPTVQPEDTIDYILSFTNVLSPINNGD